MLTREWATAKELAEMELPELPGERALRMRAERYWQLPEWINKKWKKRQESGGGNLYHYSLLPGAAQAKWIKRFTTVNAIEESERAHALRTSYEEEWRAFWERSEGQREKALFKLKVLDEAESHIGGGTRRMEAYRLAGVAHDVPEKTVHRWAGQVKALPRTEWLPFLVPGHIGRTATAECDPEAWKFFCSFYLRPERPSCEFAYRETAAAAKKHDWVIPSSATFQRWITTRLDPFVVVLKRHGAEAADRLFPAQERDRTILHAMEAVNFDGHKFDVFVLRDDGTVGRMTFVPMQDLQSDKIVAWRLGWSETAALVRLAYGDMVENVAIPLGILADNGRANASKELTGGARTRYRGKVREEDPLGLFIMCGTKEIHWATPGRGQSKPGERLFRDLSETVSKDIRCAGAWTGNNPLNKPENYGSKAVPVGVFLEVIRDAVEEYNGRPNRTTAVCGGKLSFNEAFERSFATVNLPRLPRAQRHLWMLAADGVKARARDGAIYLEKNRYWAEFLNAHRGANLTVRYDPDALHDGLMVYDASGKHLGDAPCIDKVGFFDKAGAKLHAKVKGEHKKAKRKLAQVQAPYSPAELVQMRAPTIPAPPVPENKLVRPVTWGNTVRALQFAEPALPELLDDEPDDLARTLRVINGGRVED